MLVEKQCSFKHDPFAGDMLIFWGCKFPSVELLKGSDDRWECIFCPQRKRSRAGDFLFPFLFDIMTPFEGVKVCCHPMSTLLSMVSRWHGSAT